MNLIKLCLIVLSLHGAMFSKFEYFSLYDGQSINKDKNGAGKTIVKSGNLKLREGGEYTNGVSGSMIKVQASGVVLDLADYAVESGCRRSGVSIGIEVGFSPEELYADKSVRQVSNITIKNGSLLSFDIGVIVHSGVQNITIENCNFEGVSCGIMFLGKDSLSGPIIKATVTDCTVIGHGLDIQDKTVMIEKYIQGMLSVCSYYYMQDFMPLCLRDDLNGGFFYNGVMARCVQGLTLKNLYVHNIGYQDYIHSPERGDKKNKSIGLYCKDCINVICDKVSVNCVSSELSSIGLQFESCMQLKLVDTESVYHRSTGVACGIAILNRNSAYDDGLVLLHNVRCNSNQVRNVENESVDQKSIGIYIKGPYSIQAEQVSCSDHVGAMESFGFYADCIKESLFKDCAFSKNKSCDMHHKKEVKAVGFCAERAEGLTFERCKFSYNSGFNTAIGLCLHDATTVDFQECDFFYNKAKVYAKNEIEDRSVTDSIRYQQEHEEISNHGPAVKAALTGGYGCIVEGCKKINFHKCKAQHNVGHRSSGFTLRDSSLIVFQDTDSLYQYGYGQFLHSDINLQEQGGIVPSNHNLEILDIHKPRLFNHLLTDQSFLEHLNVQKLSESLLAGTESVRAKWLLNKKESESQEKRMIASIGILSALIARFRLWGVAFGVHLHNCTGCLMQHCKFSGQFSDNDNAVGCIVTGCSEDLYVEDCVFSYNCSWKNSVRRGMSRKNRYDSVYDLSAVKPYWDMVVKSCNQATDEQEFGFFADGEKLIAQGHKELCGEGHDMYVILNQKKYNYVNIIAPLAGGLVLSDCCDGGTLLRNFFHANQGGAGYCAGLLLHIAENFLVQDNKFEDNASNIYGHCRGLMDVNLYSENSFLNNTLSFNRVDGYYNAHSLVIAESRNTESAVYPLVELNSGKAKTKISDIDNVEIVFPMSKALDKKKSRELDR